MNSEELSKKLLCLEPWYIKEIRYDHEDKCIDIWIDFQKGSRFKCPLLGKQHCVHETGERTWGHLNIFQYPVYIHAREPRIRGIEHGKKTVDLPWARKGSGFSLQFEALILRLAGRCLYRQLQGSLESMRTLYGES